MLTLKIYKKNFLVGELLIDQDHNIQFTYSDDWVKNGFYLSPHIVFDTIATSRSITNFIENLLPEGDGLEQLSQYLQISKSNKFALINTIGIETVGIFTFGKPQDEIETTFREILLDELETRIDNINQETITIWDKKPRLSVVGVQAKLPVTMIDDKFGLGKVP